MEAVRMVNPDLSEEAQSLLLRAARENGLIVVELAEATMLAPLDTSVMQLLVAGYVEPLDMPRPEGRRLEALVYELTELGYAVALRQHRSGVQGV
jgi:hypothetical protein